MKKKTTTSKSVKKYAPGGQTSSTKSKPTIPNNQYSRDSASIAKNYAIHNNPKSSIKDYMKSEDAINDIANKYSNKKLSTMGPAGKEVAKILSTPDYIEQKKVGGTVKGKTPMTAAQRKFAALAPPKNKITFADKIAGSKKRKK